MSTQSKIQLVLALIGAGCMLIAGVLSSVDIAQNEGASVQAYLSLWSSIAVLFTGGSSVVSIVAPKAKVKKAEP